MAEKVQFPTPNDPEKATTPSEKLELLMKNLERFSGSPYLAMDPELVEKAELNVWKSIEELKKEYPELNN